VRIVSLLPSATEIVCALGLEKSLVGRSHECDYPSFVRALPPCTSSKINSSLSSLQIHEQTQTLLEESKSLYEIDVPLLQNLNPNVIVTQAQCEVCAVSPAEVKKALDRWTGKKPLVVMLEAMNLEGLWKDLLSVGQARIALLRKRRSLRKLGLSKSHIYESA
jgi:iron complex transport system substrate-binding protein